MIDRLRRRLRLITYYSSSRRRSAGTVGRDRVLLVVPLFAVGAMLLGEAVVVRPVTIRDVQGKLYGDPTGPLVATVRDSERGARWAVGRLSGEWTISVTSVDRGWPFASSGVARPPRLQLNLYDEVGTRSEIEVAADAPERHAILAALAAVEERALATAWRRQQPLETGRYWLGTAVDTIIVWLLLSLLVVVTAPALALAVAVMVERRREVEAIRRTGGRCHVCDYDLRGLEFRDRCPECGSIAE